MVLKETLPVVQHRSRLATGLILVFVVALSAISTAYIQLWVPVPVVFPILFLVHKLLAVFTWMPPSVSSGSTGEIRVDDPTENVWSVYVKLLSSHDRRLAEQWKGDMNSILIFAGLFSSSLTTFLVESYQSLTPAAPDANEQLILQLTQLVLAQTNGTIPAISAASQPSTRTPTSAFICNALWFSSLAFSLICALSATMVDTWARNYLTTIESGSSALHKRARMSAYLHRGIRVFHMNALVELIPTLLHFSLLLFFAGLVEFLRPINLAISYLVLGMLVLCGGLYAVVTFLPLFYSNCPYQTPLSGLWWRIFWSFGFVRQREDVKSSVAVFESMEQAREADATEISPSRDARDFEAMRWTLSNLQEDSELESFLVFMPQMVSWIDYSAKLLLYQLLHDRNLSISLRYRIPRLLATCADGNVTGPTAHNRATVCLHAIWSLTMMAVPLSVPFAQPSRKTLAFDEETLISILATKAQLPSISDAADSAAAVVARNLLDLFVELATAMQAELDAALLSGEWSHQRLSKRRGPEWAATRVSVSIRNVQRQLQTLEQLLSSLERVTVPVVYMVVDSLRQHLDDLIEIVVSSGNDERPLALETAEYVQTYLQLLHQTGFGLTLDYIATLVHNTSDDSSLTLHAQTQLVQHLDAVLEQNPSRGTWLPASIINLLLELAGSALRDPGCAMKAHGIISHYIAVLPTPLLLTRDTARKALALLDMRWSVSCFPRSTMGAIWSQFFPPKATFSVDDIPDLTGQVMLVTGGNSGIGKEVAKGLLAHNARVYLAARNAESAKMAIAELKTQTGHDAEFLELDLADLGSIKRAAEEFTRKEKQLNVLFNNGGVMRPPVDMLTKQGYDLQFGTNVLGHFYLTKLLLPTLITTAKDSGKPARVVNTSSLVLEGAAKFDFATFKESPARAKLGTSGLYQQSKFGNAVLSAELHRRYAEEGIVSIALNPGNIMTNLGRYLSPGFLRILKYIVYDPPLGALTPLYAGTVKEGEGFGGKFLFPWARMGQVPAAVDDANNGRELWTWCEEQVENVPS
ncbi:hypothetical protein HMN09_00896700 [Mycena chlorophos]|uniref:DUF6535 domain-containing protein n=1 Tax=Mycena chlorophos TaxID=658473 RepID=A0A8H6SQM6_MYCCL|nr:hypothetical protein HMN09_00896700 [Mycena chlorophos]